MSKIKIIGLGSPFGHDQLGRIAIEKLKQSHLMQTFKNMRLQIEYHDRPGIRLLELMRDANIIFLIDAVISGHAVGTVHRFVNKKIEEFKYLLSTHDIGVAQVLALGRALCVLPQQIIFYGIEIDKENILYELSPALTSSLKQLIAYLENDMKLLQIQYGNTANSLHL